MLTIFKSTYPFQIVALMLIALMANANDSKNLPAATSLQPNSALVPFEVSYKAKLMGTELTATSKLQQLADGNFKYQYTTSSMLGKATETSLFTVSDTHNPLPLAYKYKLSALGVKKRINLAFDWHSAQLTDRAAKPQWTMKLPTGAVDPLSMQLLLRADVMRGETNLTYPVTRNGRIKKYHYVVEAEEVIDTLIGSLQAVRIRRERSRDNSKFTTIWLATDWLYMIAKIRDGEVDGTVQEVVLAGGSIDGVPISALK